MKKEFVPEDDFKNLEIDKNLPNSAVPILLSSIAITFGIMGLAQLFQYFGSFKKMCCALLGSSGGGGGGCSSGPTSCSEADFIGDGAPDCGQEDCGYCGPKYHPPPPSPW